MAWTIACYMAGDNSLSGQISSDLEEMQKGLAGVGAEIARVVAFADSQTDLTREYEVTESNVRLVKEYKNTSSGDPETLKRFLAQSVNPSTRNAILLWGHGNGWEDFGRGITSYSGLFNPAVTLKAERLGIAAKVDTRAYGRDDATGDFIDNQELSDVLIHINAILEKKVDLLIFDACLMANLECVCDVAPYCELFIGSVEKIPSRGLPYNALFQLLSQFTAHHDASEFCDALVRSYLTSYIPHGTQYQDSPIITRQSPNTPVALTCFQSVHGDAFWTGPLRRFVIAIATAIRINPKIAMIRDSALLQTPNFGPGGDYVDLAAFAENISDISTQFGIKLPEDLVNACIELRVSLTNAETGLLKVSDRISRATAPPGLPSWYRFSKDTSGASFFFPRRGQGVEETFEFWKRLRIAQFLPDMDYKTMIGIN